MAASTVWMVWWPLSNWGVNDYEFGPVDTSTGELLAYYAISSSSSPQDMCHVGTEQLAVLFFDGTIQLFSTAGVFVETVTTGLSSARSFTHDGTNFWVVTGSTGNMILREVDATGSVLNSYALTNSPNSVNTTCGITYNGTQIIIYDGQSAARYFDLSGNEDTGATHSFMTSVDEEGYFDYAGDGKIWAEVFDNGTGIISSDLSHSHLVLGTADGTIDTISESFATHSSWQVIWDDGFGSTSADIDFTGLACFPVASPSSIPILRLRQRKFEPHF